jgi:hypothetical protein
VIAWQDLDSQQISGNRNPKSRSASNAEYCSLEVEARNYDFDFHAVMMQVKKGMLVVMAAI